MVPGLRRTHNKIQRTVSVHVADNIQGGAKIIQVLFPMVFPKSRLVSTREHCYISRPLVITVICLDRSHNQIGNTIYVKIDASAHRISETVSQIVAQEFKNLCARLSGVHPGKTHLITIAFPTSNDEIGVTITIQITGSTRDAVVKHSPERRSILAGTHPRFEQTWVAEANICNPVRVDITKVTQFTSEERELDNSLDEPDC